MAQPLPLPVIKCTNHPGDNAPVARFACLECSRYLCAQCDSKVHADPAKKHYRFATSQIKSHIAFEKGATPGESHIRRNIRTPNGPAFMELFGCSTSYHAFQRAVKTHSNTACLGRRTVDAQGNVAGFEFQTYRQVGERVSNFGSGLRALGIQTKQPVGLYSANRPEWIVAEQGAFTQNMITVPLYDTLGAEAAEHIIKHASVAVVATSWDKVASLLTISATAPSLKIIAVMPTQPFEKPENPKLPASASCKVLTFEEIEKLGASKPAEHIPPSKDDIATICYTSGTTGVPKGAVLSHGNVVTNCASCAAAGASTFPGDNHLSYLPLAHMFERMVMTNVLSSGATVGFARGNPLVLLEDVEVFRPTTFPSVPRLYNRLFDKITSTIDASGGLKKFLFTRGYAAKLANLKQSGIINHSIWDRILFSKISARLGGRVRYMVTGSAPISDNVMQFLRLCFSCPVIEGYGQTEASAAVTVTDINDHRTLGNVGTPLPCNEIKLVDVGEMGYTSKDVINGIPCPRGEICVRGTNVFQGYYHDDEKTAEALDQDGWLHSGDIGVWLPDGSLKIIDRKKNIFKLSQGEYIAPEKIENIYVKAKSVAQIFVHGDSLQSELIGIVVPDEEELTAWAKRNRIPFQNFAELCKNPAVNQLIMNEMAAAGNDGKLRGFEMVKAIHVSSELFSVENGILTPTFKLKRDSAKKKYNAELDGLYKKLEKKELEIKSQNPQLNSKL